MRLLRFLIWLRRKRRPLTPDQQWEATQRALARHADTKTPIWDYRGHCRLCKRPKDEPYKVSLL